MRDRDEGNVPKPDPDDGMTNSGRPLPVSDSLKTGMGRVQAEVAAVAFISRMTLGRMRSVKIAGGASGRLPLPAGSDSLSCCRFMSPSLSAFSVRYAWSIPLCGFSDSATSFRPEPDEVTVTVGTLGGLK